MVVTTTDDSTFSSDVLTSISNIQGIKTTEATHVDTNMTFTNEKYSDQTIAFAYTYYENFVPTILYGNANLTRNEILINETLAQKISDSALIDCVGTSITLTLGTDSQEFTIGGIYKDNTSYYEAYNIYLYNNAMSSYFTNTTLTKNLLYVECASASYVNAVMEDIKAINPRYSIFQEDSNVSSVTKYVDLGTSVLSGVSGISMIVSAIMIFIVLYISISERMKEIGILRSIGARRKDIQKIFFFEAGIMGFIGGAIACIGCLTLTIITNSICSITLHTTLISYNILYYLLGLVLSTIISILAGIAPSMKASHLDPVDCLRYE